MGTIIVGVILAIFIFVWWMTYVRDKNGED